MNHSQKTIIDTEFQKDIFEDEFRTLMQNMMERQNKMSDLSKQLEESVQKAINLNQQQFEKELKNKQKELKKNKMENEKRVQKIMKEYELTENQNLSLLLTKQKEYLQFYENLYSEQRKLFVQFDHEGGQINHHALLVKQTLTDGLLFQEIFKPTTSILFDYLGGSNKQKISSLHSSFEVIFQQLKSIEDNLILITNNNPKETHLQLLLQRLNTFITLLRTTQHETENILLEMQAIQSEINGSEKIRKNNITLIQTIMKENQDQREIEIQDYLKLNDSLIKSLFSIIETNRKYNIYQKDNIDDLHQIQQMAKLSSINTQNTLQLTRRNSMKHNAMLKKTNTIQLSRLRIYSDHHKETLKPPKEHHDINTPPVQRDTAAQSFLLYQYPQKSDNHLNHQPVVKQGSILTSQFNQGSPKNGDKSCSVNSFYKNSCFADKKTAIPLKCVCPPQCLCQAQVNVQLHTCNNQLYINTRGEVMCQQCSFFQNIQDYSFYCAQNRQKNKFRTYQDFFQSFWQHLITLSMNQQTSDFWSTLQANCQMQWIQNKPQEILDISIELHLVSFASFCPYDSKCYHKTSQQQFHICQCPLMITSQGEIYCKKCHYYGNPQYYFLQCPETKNYNTYRNIDSFINTLDLSYTDNDSEKFNAQFILQLKRFLTKKWR